MVVLHQLVAAFVSLVQMAQLATERRNVGESTLGRQVRLVCMLKLFTFMRTQYVCFKTILKTGEAHRRMESPKTEEKKGTKMIEAPKIKR